MHTKILARARAATAAFAIATCIVSFRPVFDGQNSTLAELTQLRIIQTENDSVGPVFWFKF